MNDAALYAGLLLPWLTGMTALAVLGGKRAFSAPGEIAWIAGAGYLVGAFLLTLWMRLLSQAGVGFSAFAVAAPLSAATIAAGLVVWRRAGTDLPRALRAACRAALSPPGLDAAARLAWRALFAWIGLRFLLGRSWHALPVDAWTRGRPRRASGSNWVGSSRSRALTPGSRPTAQRISTQVREIRRRYRCCRCGPASHWAAGTTR
jgi:hypothetical protein